MINANKPTGRSRHIDIRFFPIQDWKDAKSITMKHIPGVINPADDLTKPLGYVLHSRHARHIMGHRKQRTHHGQSDKTIKHYRSYRLINDWN